MFARFAARDGALLVVAALLWQAEPEWRSLAGAGAAAWEVAAGLAAGVVAAIAHEWGHLAGAALSRSRVAAARSLASPFIFRFDTKANSRRQFLAMSYGGFVASAAVLAAYLVWLPLGALSGKVALGLVGAGLLATITLEVPAVWRVHRGGPLPTGAIYGP